MVRLKRSLAYSCLLPMARLRRSRLLGAVFLAAAALAAPRLLAQRVAALGASSTSLLRFDSLVADFGTVLEGDKVSRDFTFTNLGPRGVRIEHVKSTCSCTVTRWTEGRIAPGQTGSISVTFDSRNRSGPQRKKLMVLTSEPGPVQVPLAVLARVDNPLVTRPGFLCLTRGGEASWLRAESIIATGEGITTVAMARKEGDFFDAHFEPRGGRYVLSVRAVPSGKSEDTLEGAVVLAYGGRLNGEKRIPVRLVCLERGRHGSK